MGEMKHTPGPWEYVPGNENHGPYVSNPWGAGDICDCYTMSNLSSFAICNGGDSKPVNHQHEEAEANARLIAAAPDLLEALTAMDHFWTEDFPEGPDQAAARRLFDDETIAIWRRIRTALSKAEGRSLSSASGQEGGDHG